MLDEHLLHERVRFAVVVIVMPLADLSDLSKLGVAEDAATVAERLESVFRLARHHDVADQSQEIAFTRSVGQVTSFAKHCPNEFLSSASLGAEHMLVILEHSLMLANVRNVAAAKISKANVFGLFFVVF